MDERTKTIDGIVRNKAASEQWAWAAVAAYDAGMAAERERIAQAWDGVECDVHCNGLVDVGASIRAGQLVDRDKA